MNRSLGSLLLIPWFLLILSACAPPATRPIGTVHFTPSRASGEETLLVFLPGIRSRAEAYAGEGFVSAVRESGMRADMIGVDAHIGYYLKKEFIATLREDVIGPAKELGYSRIWLVGISLGGFGAIWYDLENPGDLAGVVSLAPYLGEPEVVAEVEAAGGVVAWQPEPGTERDDQHRIWLGLKRYLVPERSERRIFLGYGLDDKFAAADSMLAAILPPQQFYTVAGGHDWPTWRSLWEEFLKRRVFEPPERTE